MNQSPRWVDFFAQSALFAEHWSTLGKHNAKDTELMDFARKNEYVVFTHDLDFSAILAATQGEKPSVVQLRSDDVNPETVGKIVIASLKKLEHELNEGALVTIDLDRTRIRLLPLRIKH
jgi:predicted nuclease of predicted toxin-antitoxin system